jgi:hypothetical protein
MASIINASSTGSGGIVQTADASGVLQLQSNGTVAVNILSGTSVAVGSATAYNGGGFGANLSIYNATAAAVTVVNANEQFQIGANSANNLGFYNPTHATYMAAMNQYGIGVGTAVPSSGFGITFPSTQSPSSDANTLDDYEEGTWTPELTFGLANTGITYSTRSASYIKIGQLVFVSLIIVLSSKGSATGDANISLPFPTNSGLFSYSCAAFSSNNLTLPSGAYNISNQGGSGGAVLSWYGQISGGAKIGLTNAQFSNTTEIILGYTYRTSA